MIPRALLTLNVLPHRYVICRLDAKAEVPFWCGSGDFSSVSRTADELSIVCVETSVPSGVVCEAGWRILNCEGPLDSAGLRSSGDHGVPG
jgi:uncharacterized protein